MADTRDALTVDFEKRFATGVQVAAKIDVSLAAGSILVLFGPSGAGKTTILRTLAGLERPDRGRVVFHGERWVDDDGRWVSPQGRRIGYVSQESSLFPHLTVRRNIEYGVSPERGAIDGRSSEEVATICGVRDLLDRRPRELSGGQAQRVALARALTSHPRLLLLDEPLASLDVPTRVQLRADVRTLLKRLKIPGVLVTHDRNDALAVGDQIAVIAEGSVRQVGSVADVFSQPTDIQVAASVGVENVLPAVIERVDSGLLTLALGRAQIHAVARNEVGQAGDEVFACVRAEDVALERQPSSMTSARNRLTSTVVSIVREGPIDLVRLDCGFPLIAVVTRQAREEMALVEGSVVVAVLKATAVHVVLKQ